ncbi:MAG: MarR family winged helix-turn-helix transcriptional regulator [Flavobacteriales bacterium]
MKKEDREIHFPTIDHVLRSTWLAVFKMYNEQAAHYDSTMVTGFTLLSIDPEKGTPSTSLGPRMGIEPTSLSRTIKNLEERGLIVRTPNPEDGRSVLICLTDYGQKMREVSKETVLTFNNRVREIVDPEKMKHFFEVISTIHNLIDNNQIFNKKNEKNS